MGKKLEKMSETFSINFDIFTEIFMTDGRFAKYLRKFLKNFRGSLGKRLKRFEN